MSVGTSFENSALKSSFSLSSLRTGGGSGLTASGPLSKASVERPYHSLTKKRKDPNRESWRRSWGSQYSGQSVLASDDLWAALQHNYDYIMDNHIIDTCKEANGELLASNSSVLPPSHGNLYNRQWSLHQLIMEFTDMWQWLTAMQDQIYSSPENSSNRTLRLTHMSELTQAEPRLEKLIEQAGAILARIPEASEEVVWRVKHIRVKWESVRQLLSVEDASADGDATGVVDNTEHEIRCLRRWLHTMEGRLPPPSAAAARGCSRQELLRKLHEYQVLQRDVECHGRIVGAVLRRRGAGCAGAGAGAGAGGLERRWQLLFLRALEWQCHLDACLAGLENREDTSCVPTDSDDEPALKQRRLSKRTSPRRAPRTTPERTTGINGHRYTPASSCESDESYSEEDNEENYSSLVSYRYNSDSSQFDILPPDCTEHNLEVSATMELEGNERGVPGTHESTPVNEGTRGDVMGDSQLDLVDGVCCTTNDATMYDDDSANQISIQTPPTVIKRSKRKVNSSKFNQSDRKSKNCATFYFKHHDTDSDRQMIDTDDKTQDESSEEEWTYAGGEKQHLEGVMLLIDAEGDVAMADQELKGKTEGCVPEKAKSIEPNETQSIQNENEEAAKAKFEQNAQQIFIKENINRLVNQADEWVQKQAQHQGSPVSVKKIKVSRNFKPLSFEGEGKGVNKMSRIKEWLRQHSDGKADNSLQSLDSYDASGECTTGESEADKQSLTSEEPSLDTYRNMTCSMEMSMISSTSTITPSNNTTPVHHGKVTLRKKKTSASGTRPWSVSCLSQLTLGQNEPTGVSGSSLNTTPVQPTNTTSAYSRVSGMSISESALNTIVSPSHNMISHNLNKANQGKVQSSTSSVKTAIQGHISSTTTINDACISCYENVDPKQCSMRRKRLKLRRRQQAHLSGELDFEDIRPEQRKGMSKRQDRLVKCSSFSGQPTERIEDRLERSTASDPSSSRKNRFDTSSASGNDSDEDMTKQQPAILPCNRRTEQTTTDQDPSSTEVQTENVRPSFKVGPAGGWVRGRLSLTERDNERAPDMLGLNLGDPALLWDVSADKDSDIDRSIRTGGTEEHSSFSEQAWDSYQEKYNSEAYSEAPDSDAARQLLECDDYRAFLDSQSDCCSSLSAHPDHDTSPHNFTRRRPNLDDHREKSLPRYRKPGKVELTDSSLPRRIKKTSLSSAERKKNLMDSLERSKISSSADNTEVVRRRKMLHDSLDRRTSKKTSLSDSFDRLNLQPHGHRRRHSSNTTSSDVNSSLEYTSINHQNRPDLLDTLNRRTRKQSANSERSRDSSELQNQGDSSLNSADSRQSHNDESLESYASDLKPVLRKRGLSLTLQVHNDTGDISDAMESDLELYDIRSLVQRSLSQLEFTESMFAKQETSPDLIRSGDYNEIIATCRKNINCLETILVGAAEGDHHILLPAYCKEIKALSARWSMLRAAAARRGGARRLRRELAALRDAVQDATRAALTADARPQLHTRHHLTRRIDELKEQLSTLLEYKVSMLKLNVSVHRLLADMGLNDPEVNVTGGVSETVCHALKDEVAELYRAWEDAHQRTSAELISLENVLEAWMSWEDGLKELQLALNGDSATLRLIESALCAGHSDSVIPHVRDMANILSEKEQQKAETSGSLSDSGISDAGSDRPLSERERRLATLRRAARVLEAALAPGSHVLKAMAKRMEQTESELRTLQTSCRALIMRTAARAGELKADNGGVLAKHAGNAENACPKTASDDPEDEPSGSSFLTKRWLWRIFKSALPFQLCMLALLCAAYLLDHPRCCDAVNNLGMSFSPQLRYVRGPPPI